MPDESLDLIYAVSVFTHLTEHWASWLLELHRLLRPGGMILATFMGEGVWDADRQGETWDANRVGMLASGLSTPWSYGGPAVFHSSWWVEDRWGRLFDIEDISPTGFRPQGYTPDHGFVLGRRTTKRCTYDELTRTSSDEREIPALQHQVESMYREGAAFRDRQVSGREAVRALTSAARRRLRRPLA